ncbi:protein NDH-DEPENDENT CYCLIC ELECTRON FLOW 5 isoform X1 [Vigna radiata var. radiata]|uniref:Protein NDH-DEPENDENT CYCLIC ELECTRON FLOW 5 isoform X1 n=1 Tax=Vigna radiata var. radiata TaxID=3916 RepID=A0A1S3VZX7_VIGRR|nr:protein NDH-DEPENDENT CYCLIC ELECTRON FLOW 5 isoform X1 [Vigna radiata var. radiata]
MNMMAFSSLFCSTRFIPTPFLSTATYLLSPQHNCASFIPQKKQCKREFPLPAVASVPHEPINFEYLQEEFSGHGVTFEEACGSCVVKMELRNGSTVTMMLPSGLITSYKALMWHGGKVELLHTSVSEGENGDPLIQGGVSLNFNFQTDHDGELSWSPTNWVLHKIHGKPRESIQVELATRTPDGKIGLKYIVTLEKDTLNSQLKISNRRSLPLLVTGSILNHLTLSSPEATYAIGLEGSSYCSIPLFESEFMLSPKDSSQGEGFGKVFPQWSTKSQNNGLEGSQVNNEEIDNYKQLSEELSLLYTEAPRSFTVIDRGRRNSVSVGRSGFDEMYLFSPGSRVEIYSKYSYICVGQASILKPIIISPQDVWRGEQFIYNPNLDA